MNKQFINNFLLGEATFEITDSQKLLANKEGLFAEPTSAAAFAGLSHLQKAGIVNRDDTVLVPITGFGLKDKFPVL